MWAPSVASLASATGKSKQDPSGVAGRGQGIWPGRLAPGRVICDGPRPYAAGPRSCPGLLSAQLSFWGAVLIRPLGLGCDFLAVTNTPPVLVPHPVSTVCRRPSH